MIRLGVVAAGPAVRIGDGTQASAGDLILCTRNDHTVHAREPGRTLANGDHCALPNPTRLPTPSAPNSPSPRSTHRAR